MPNKTLRILFLYNSIFVLAGSLLGPLYALYVEGIDKGVLPVSISWATYLFSATLFTYLMSRWGDGIKQKRIFLAGGYLIRAVCWLYFSFINQMEALIVVQFFLGIGEALGTPAFDAIFAEHLDKDRHIMDYSDWKVLSNGVLVVGTLAGGMIVTKLGFSILFQLMAVMAVVALFGVMANPRLDSKRS